MNDSAPPLKPPLDVESFARLFVAHQRVLFGYLVNLLGDLADAEEVLQETSVVLWQQRERFVPGTNFVAWACAIARHQVLRFRRNRKRRALSLSADLLDQIAAEGLAQQDRAESRRLALEKCRQKLAPDDLRLLDALYGEDLTVVEAAERLGRPLNTLYKGVQRIRQKLLRCIERTLQAEEAP